MERISDAMLREHKRLHDILERLEESLEYDNKNWKELFNKFKWSLKKHFFIEEKVIFEICNSNCGEKIPEIFNLMKEHGEIIYLMSKIDSELNVIVKAINFLPSTMAFPNKSRRRMVDISVLDYNLRKNLLEIKEKLIKHSNFEDNNFYPLLDEKLSEERKLEILSRVKEIVR